MFGKIMENPHQLVIVFDVASAIVFFSGVV
jgi:hypothetical protein